MHHTQWIICHPNERRNFQGNLFFLECQLVGFCFAWSTMYYTCIPGCVDGWVNSSLDMCLCIRLGLLNSRLLSSSENSGNETSGIYLVGSYCRQGDVLHDIQSWLHCSNLALCINMIVFCGEIVSCHGPRASVYPDIEIAPFFFWDWVMYEGTVK